MSRGFISPDSRGTLFTQDEVATKSGKAKKNHFASDGAQTDIQAQNVKTARVYVFGQADMDDEEHLGDNANGMEMSELRPRGAAAGSGSAGKRRNNNSTSANRDKEEFLEKDIADGDTLQSVALQYGCQVSELKRINKLISDQEFFALKVIKVPVRRHGLLTELIKEENRKRKNGPKLSLRPPNGTNDSIIAMDDINCEDFDDDGSDSESQSLYVRTLSIRDVCNNPSRDAQEFLRTMDHDLEKIRKSTNSYKGSLEEVAKTLTCKRIYPIRKKSVWNGADCGLSWRTVVVIVIGICLIAPLTYLLYYKFGKPPD
ncbi:lysM and putative peptidoglycan-binding domain-containing protein 3-like [Lineus longissimus]|uniref:lysM and putative peptidoglycan-binding domain-containing protein 3-like n=1 Tax=Lineus longissimus TaxID=88925 RepID=UPI00315C9527